MTEDEARINARYPKRSTLDYVLGIGATVAVIGAIGLVLVDGLDRANPLWRAWCAASRWSTRR
ncbi:hypothetical protein G7085_05995 [Tessaracoccus sp. HDW20]|uniref:hypothetical protein n=1 Tax=Tessaracoccus coleopterorum TaxID=2714950 RepID=UPI0018D2B072|nr:hypothetical protein [Tessaracoccus coleopterorum]NHB84308.1 hypothetical protein [Tessaracoccus coleopterorum]